MCMSRPSGGGLRGRGVDQHPELHPELHPGMQFTRAPDPPPAESEGARTEAAAAPAAAHPAAAKVKAAKPPDLGAWKEIQALLSALPRLAATAQYAVHCVYVHSVESLGPSTPCYRRHTVREVDVLVLWSSRESTSIGSPSPIQHHFSTAVMFHIQDGWPLSTARFSANE